MSGFLNSISDLYYRAHRSRLFAVLVVLVFLACIGIIASAQPEAGLDLKVYDLTDRTSITASMDRYFEVEGRLIPEARYQTKRNIGFIQLSGGTYVPIEPVGRDDRIFILDENIPAPDANGNVKFIGQLVTAGDPAVSYYFEVGRPTDVPLINRVARIGLIIAAITFALLLIGWLIRRSSYALSAGNATDHVPAATPEWMWFGSLGARFQNAYLRQAPARLNTSPQQISFESSGSEPWSVVVRRAEQAVPQSVATAYGSLPAIRLRFEDERGLVRQGVAVASNAAARDALLSRLKT